MTTFSNNDQKDSADQSAAEWVLRHDRGLTAVEQDEFSQWLAADPKNRLAWAEHRWGWDELDRLAGLQTSLHAVPNPDLLAPRTTRRSLFLLPKLLPVLTAGLAAVLVIGVLVWQRPGPREDSSTLKSQLPAPTSLLSMIEQRELADGSVVDLNRGAILVEHFVPGERRVVLERGEAHFTVAKDAARPFVVEVAGVAIRAVGTAFNVRLDSAAVEVLVTEGKVGVARIAADPVENEGNQSAAFVAGKLEEQAGAESRLVAAGERALVSLAVSAPIPEGQPVSAAELEARMAWKPRLLDFTNAPLSEIVPEFNRRNPVQLRLGDPSLHALRLSATFRSDNVEGFVRLMTSNFGMRAERRDGHEIVLYPARSPRD